MKELNFLREEEEREYLIKQDCQKETDYGTV
jgi:hypothetical protein